MEAKEGEQHGISEEDENEQFDEVLFKDNEKNDDKGSEEGSCRSSNLDGVGLGRLSDGLREPLETSQDRYMIEFDGSPIVLGQRNHKSLTTRTAGQEEGEVDSPSSVVDLDDESEYSPIGSPPTFKERAVMPTVFPELLHLVDSTIMGEPESLEKLKNVVHGVETFGDEWDSGIVAFLTVDSLLATMGGVENFDDDNPPSVILNSRAAIVSAELIPWLPCHGDSYIAMSPRSRMVRGLLAILQACTRNRAVCSTAGLLSVLLRSAENIFVHSIGSKDQMRWDAAPLFCCIEYLAEHSLSIIDLQSWFQVITQTLTTALPPRLMVAFEKAIVGEESTGPACTFELIGESSGLLGPGDSPWPFSNGYAFATWIYIESFTDTSTAADAASTSGIASPKSSAASASALPGEDTTHMPRLFIFSSGENEGMEAYFRAEFLVVESGNGRGKKASLHFTYAFKPKCWYFIGVEHTCQHVLLGKDESELRLYIDGSLHESRPFEFTQISKPLAFFCIGTNPPPTMARSAHCPSQCSLFGEMGPIYIFKEPIGPEKMAYLARRGSDVLPSFDNGAALPWLATSDYVRRMAEESSMLDAEIAGYIYVLYHPKLLSGCSCPDASPSSEAGLLQRPAQVLGQVHIATRIRPIEALWAFAYGGPMSLLPLTVSNMKSGNLEPEQENLSLSLATTALAAPIIRIIAMSIRHPGNSEELSRGRGPEILSKILHYLLETWSSRDARYPDGEGDEELVAAVVSLCQAPEHNHALKVQLFSMLLLDLEIWSCCKYGLQKRLLSSLTNMVTSESSVLQDANAIQMLLDGCRRCYWIVRETDSAHTCSLNRENHPVGEVNALVEDVFAVIELLVVAAPPSSVVDDMHRLLGFMVDCPQPNQVSRVVHLLYRLASTSRSKTFMEAFLSCGGIEALLILLQREVMAGDHGVSEFVVEDDDEDFPVNGYENGVHPEVTKSYEGKDGVLEKNKVSAETNVSEPEHYTAQSTSGVKSVKVGSNVGSDSLGMPTEEIISSSECYFVQNVGGVSFKTSADNAGSNIYIFNESDGIALAIIKLLSSLIVLGHLKVGSQASEDVPSNLWVAGMHASSSSMFEDKVCLLFFSLQKAFHAAPTRLLTSRVYIALLGASINAAATDDRLYLYDSGHRFKCLDILVVLLRSLPYASRAVQRQALQDLLFLACSHSENRSFLTQMKEWPEWILEVLISNYERGSDRGCSSTTMEDIDDLVHNFLTDMLESCMRKKDGWKEVEATIHCAEWLSIVGGSSIRDHCIRREESLPIFKRRLLGTLLDFYAQELQVQTHVNAAAGVAADCPSPKNVEEEAESDSLISLVLVENAIVILMLVEDHLRLQSKIRCASPAANTTYSSLKFVTPMNKLSNSLSISSEEPKEDALYNTSLPGHLGSLPLDVLTSMADDNGRISPTMMECLTAAAAAEPYESVSCAFVSYGSCASDLVEGWRYRSKLWYGVGVPSNEVVFGGGGSGWESWNSKLEKDSNGKWIEIPLIKRSIAMLQALLLDETGLGEGLSIGGGYGTRMGGMDALHQLLDSDQPFLCMLRMVLLSMREEDSGESNMLVNSLNYDDLTPKVPYEQAINIGSLNTKTRMSMRPSRSALLWSVLSLILNMPISEAKRQRVLVTSCVLYSEIWHAIGKDRNPLRKKYLEAIIPAFVSILRRWRPVLAGIQELAIQDGLNPLVVDGEALAADALPLQAALGMISPGWASAFASPPAAMALAMNAAGASGGEAPRRRLTAHLRRDGSLLERKKTKLQTFSSFQETLELPKKSPSTPREKAAAKASALSSARDIERNAKVGSRRGLIAVAMATSEQRRNAGDMQRAQRWSICEAMDIAWMECLQPLDTRSVYGKDLDAIAYEFIAVLVASFALARNIQRSEIDRRNQVALRSKHSLSTGSRAWRKLVHYLIETSCLFGPSARHLCNPEQVFWRLNIMESSCRTRRCLRRNYRSFDHFGRAANFLDHVNKGQSQPNIKNPSNHSLLIPEAISAIVMTKGDDHSESYNLSSKNFDGEQDVDRQPTLSTEPPTKLLSESRDDRVTSNRDMEEVSAVVAPGYFPIELDERIILELHTSMVRLLKVVRGTFQITSKRINFIAGNAEGNAAGDRLDSSSEFRDQVKNHSWMISSLNVVYSRRYLLRRSALELCMLDRSIFFFDFGSNENRRNAYKAIIQAHPIHLNNIYLATERPDQLLIKTQLMERWARREISNFEYLMELNTLAGRSYNDITQYPVFPWILSDYISNDLDLSNPDSYRDLSKPVGALNPEHLLKIQQRYSSFNDPFIPKFHYGSHYSSVGAVLFYLVRLEPFTTLSIQLKGGKSNHEERMFSDVAATWRGVLEDTSDVKELVPELFYLPESLISQHSIDFGMEKYGEKLDDVKLPAWAKDPVDFVYKHRMALESEHVSAHLHEWIDLIFGYKQRGNEAIVANNVFFCGSYEGAIDVNKISDPAKRRATQDQVACLGQTPSQLLTVPHMKRMPSEDVRHLQTIFRNPNELKSYVVPMPELCNLPASAIHASSDAVIIVGTHAPAAHIAQHKWQPNTPDGQGAPFVFQHGQPATNPTSGALMRLFKGPIASDNDECQSSRALAFAASGIRSSAIVGITKYKEIITGGHADNSVRLVSADGAKTLEVAFGHRAPVTCLSLSSDSSYLVTGSQDTTVILWRIHPGASFPSNNMLQSSSGSETPASTNRNLVLADKGLKRGIEGPVRILHGHHREIVCCCVNSDLGVVVSCSHSSDILLHTIRWGRLIRRLVGVEAHEICASSDGIIMAWNQPLQTLTTLTLNGILIATAQLPFYGCISCLNISSDGQTALIGINSCPEDDFSFDARLEYQTDDNLKSDGGQERRRLNIPSPSICFLDLHTQKVLHTLDLKQGQDITALALNNDHTHLLVSTSDNQLIIFTHRAGS